MVIKTHSLTVSELNQILKEGIENNPGFQDLWIVGDINNLKFYRLGGQWYFNLSDGQSQLQCVIYASFLKNLTFQPKDGLAVVARGKLIYRHKKGQLIFQVAYMMEAGVGNLALQFEALKQALYKEGLFDEQFKKAIPRYPERVGLITSPNSAAQWDFIKQVEVYSPHIRLYLYPAVMQGPDSPNSVMDAITLAQKHNSVDVLVLLRGGGSAEDLAGFNHEGLVRHCFACKIPLITALGHEVDTSLADLVADLRAATPTWAGQELCSRFYQLKTTLPERMSSLSEIMKQRIDLYRDDVGLNLKRLRQAMHHRFEKMRDLSKNLNRRVIQANPLHKMKQGFSIATLVQTGDIIKSVDQILVGDTIETRCADGSFDSKVTKLNDHRKRHSKR